MGLSNIFRRAGRGVASVGRAVQAASQKLDQAVQPRVEAMPEMQPAAPAPGAPTLAPAPTATGGAPANGAAPTEGAPAAAAPKGFQLPDLGPPPDPNATQYQGDEGKKRYESDIEQYQHKQDIHQAFTDLDKVYTQAFPSRDFEKEYREEVSMQKAHEDARPKGNNLARAALALGDFNPAVQQSGRSNLADYNANVDKDAAQSDKSFAQRMMLRQKMHESAAAEAEAKGNWKKALAESEKSQLLAADNTALSHKREMEKVNAQQKGALDRANVRADAMERTAKMRATAIGSAHGLSGTFQSQFEKEAAKAVARMLGPRDLTKEYTPYDVDTITNYLEQLAEMFHDQQYGAGSSKKWMGTHPSKRATSAKEKF